MLIIAKTTPCKRQVRVASEKVKKFFSTYMYNPVVQYVKTAWQLLFSNIWGIQWTLYTLSTIAGTNYVILCLVVKSFQLNLSHTELFFYFLKRQQIKNLRYTLKKKEP